jgi:hypothetical protein
MKSMLNILFVAFVLSACSEDDDMVLANTYEGIFYRIYPQARINASDVTLQLTGDNFSGSSSIQNYPAICSGTYEIDGSSITFSNQCAFTADFDWSYILDGVYEIDESEQYIYFIQEVDTDIYNVFRFPGED